MNRVTGDTTCSRSMVTLWVTGLARVRLGVTALTTLFVNKNRMTETFSSISFIRAPTVLSRVVALPWLRPVIMSMTVSRKGLPTFFSKTNKKLGTTQVKSQVLVIGFIVKVVLTVRR